ncbi:GntR family transcriptional regulator [Actinotalea solisilvae]|uniref:GntR family transcriptional regulator n=1 Tax=Actinotalea solisilvae TaxID=2072922 RepID=UPI0018F20C56|nr:GntR family transcriptional regulator [Actinotalea solisilvae]
MLFRIDPSAPEPLFAQLAGQVRSAVAAGGLRPGERLPSARDLAASLDVNIHTVLRAYQDLRDEGLIDLRRGRGAVVAAGPATDYAPLHAAIAEVVATARRLGVSPETTTALLKEALR